MIGWWCTLLGQPSQPHWLLYYLRATMWFYIVCVYICTLVMCVTSLDSCVAGHWQGICFPHCCCQCNNTKEWGLYSKLYVHLCISILYRCSHNFPVLQTFMCIFHLVFIYFFFHVTKLQKKMDNTVSAEHIRQTTLSILGTAHLTSDSIIWMQTNKVKFMCIVWCCIMHV